MGGRKQALWRILGLAYLSTIGWIVILITGMAGSIYMTIDIILQLIFGGDGWGGGSFLLRVYDYGWGQTSYVIFGEGEFPILP